MVTSARPAPRSSTTIPATWVLGPSAGGRGAGVGGGGVDVDGELHAVVKKTAQRAIAVRNSQFIAGAPPVLFLLTKRSDQGKRTRKCGEVLTASILQRPGRF